MFTNDGIKEGADGYALLQRDLAEAVRDRQLDGDGVRRPLPRVFASAARLNFKISEWRLLRKYSSTVGVTSRCRRCSPRRLAMRTSALVTCAYVPTSIPAGPTPTDSAHRQSRRGIEELSEVVASSEHFVRGFTQFIAEF